MEKNTDKRRGKLLVQPITPMTAKLMMPHERHQMRKATYYRITLGKGEGVGMKSKSVVRAQEQK